MKIVYQNTIWLLTFIAYNYLCLANENSITIATFFNEEDSQAKMALESAVHKANMMQSHLKYVLKTEILSKMDIFHCCNLLCNLTRDKPGLAGVFSPASHTSSATIQSVCTNLEIPHFLTDWRSASFQTDKYTTLNFFPDSDLLSYGLATIVKNLQWRSFVVLYEDDEGLIRLQEILKLQNFNKYGNIMVRQLQPGSDNRPLLKEIRASGPNFIILDCASDNIIKILKQAKEVNLMDSSSYNYFLTSLDAHTVDFSVLDVSVNITTIRIIDPKSDDFQSALSTWATFSEFYYKNQIDLRPYSIKTKTALMHDAIHLFIESLNALHVTGPVKTSSLLCDLEEKWNDGLRISSFMKLKTNPSGASGPINFDSTGHRTNFTIHVVQGHRGNVVARWNAENPNYLSLTRSENDTYEALVKSLQKGVLIVSSRLGPPYLMERKPKYEGQILTGNARYEGFSMDLIDAIAGILHFKYEFRLAEDGKYGNYDEETKSWNGLIKDLLDRKADLAICDLTITHQRRQVVDFSMPFMRLGISILYKKAEEKNINMFTFLDPFSTEIWIYTATLYLAVSVILYFVARMAPGDWENPHPCDPHPEELENIWNLKNSLWLTLGSIMTQGCDILPKGISSRVFFRGISSRMVTSMWWFFSLIMTSSYTANLAAFLTMERMEPIIDSAEALAKQTKIKYGTVEGGATQAFFRDSNYSTFQKMWTSMAQAKPSVFEKNNEDGVKRVRGSKTRTYAFLMESSQIEYETQTKCDLKQIGSWLDSKGYGIAMPIDYPYRSAINTAILKLQEDSKLKELKIKWWEKMRDEPPCPVRTSEKSSSELALVNVGGVFLVLGIGVGVAFLLATVEFLWNVRRVSVKERLSYSEALRLELVFATNIWITKKRARSVVPSGSSQDSKSLRQGFFSGVGSLLNLNTVGTAAKDD